MVVASLIGLGACGYAEDVQAMRDACQALTDSVSASNRGDSVEAGAHFVIAAQRSADAAELDDSFQAFADDVQSLVSDAADRGETSAILVFVIQEDYCEKWGA
jgi:hypothetical protein